jgi:hypothetical protein
MLAEGEGREVATCGGWGRVLRRKNSEFLRVSAAAAGYFTKGHGGPVVN